MSRYRPVAVVIQLSPEDFGAETFDADHVNCFARGAEEAFEKTEDHHESRQGEADPAAPRHHEGLPWKERGEPRSP